MCMCCPEVCDTSIGLSTCFRFSWADQNEREIQSKRIFFTWNMLLFFTVKYLIENDSTKTLGWRMLAYSTFSVSTRTRIMGDVFDFWLSLAANLIFFSSRSPKHCRGSLWPLSPVAAGQIKCHSRPSWTQACGFYRMVVTSLWTQRQRKGSVLLDLNAGFGYSWIWYFKV